VPGGVGEVAVDLLGVRHKQRNCSFFEKKEPKNFCDF
jgi:hypothetical protein